MTTLQRVEGLYIVRREKRVEMFSRLGWAMDFLTCDCTYMTRTKGLLDVTGIGHDSYCLTECVHVFRVSRYSRVKTCIGCGLLRDEGAAL